MAEEMAVIEAVGFSLKEAAVQGRMILEGISLTLRAGRILAIIGPTASGKSTFLKSINRLCELEYAVLPFGTLRVLGEDVYAPKTDVLALRRRVGMVFSRPTLPVPGIFDNVALAPRIMGVHDRAVLASLVERCLRQVGLWEALAGRLSENANTLSAEYQQRLCIARVLATDPAVLLFDEPTAHLDYPSAGHVEDLICDLAKKYPLIIAAQTPQQAAHVSSDTAFFWDGRLVEFGPTEEVLTNPKDPRTEAYITGRFDDKTFNR